jgi:Sulfotransferase family
VEARGFWGNPVVFNGIPISPRDPRKTAAGRLWYRMEMPPESLAGDTVMTPTAEEIAQRIREAKEIAQAHHFVFLGGLHRSGTTLVFRMLREHPAMSGFNSHMDTEEWLAAHDEGQYLQTVYPPAVYWGGPGKFAFHPDAHMTEQSEFLTEENKAKIARQWFKYWDLSKRFLLEKSPPNLLWTRFLQSAFPNSSFIIIQRHPVAVTLATEKWSPTGLNSLMEHWLVAHEIFEKDRPYLQRVMTLKHEALVSDPNAVLRQISDFLGVEPHHTTFQATSEHNQKYFTQWQELALNPETRDVIQDCIARYGPRVEALGYSLLDLEKY